MVSTTSLQVVILNKLNKDFYGVPEVIYKLIDFNENLPTNFKSSFDFISAESIISKTPNIEFINLRNKIHNNVDKIHNHVKITISKYPNNFKKLRDILKEHEEQLTIYKLTIATLNKYATEIDLSKAPENFKVILQNINIKTLGFLDDLWSDL